jgi:hypothetical protein
VLDRLVAAGLSQERIEQNLTAAEMEVGRPPGVAHGSHLDASLALNFPQLPLAPGRYQWRADIAADLQTESFMVQQK